MAKIDQTFDQIKSIEAINGNIVIRVYPTKDGKPLRTASDTELKSTILSVKEAAQRAIALNEMVGRQVFSTAEAKDTLDVVEELVAKIKEAKEFLLKKNKDPDNTKEL
jgi:DNA polymerase elongation subunit (family B)